jgi:hypothetical protein
VLQRVLRLVVTQDAVRGLAAVGDRAASPEMLREMARIGAVGSSARGAAEHLGLGVSAEAAVDEDGDRAGRLAEHVLVGVDGVQSRSEMAVIGRTFTELSCWNTLNATTCSVHCPLLLKMGMPSRSARCTRLMATDCSESSTRCMRTW